MTDKTQAEAVAILRQTKMGCTVSIVVSRQDTADDKFKVPRELVSIVTGCITYCITMIACYCNCYG